MKFQEIYFFIQREFKTMEDCTGLVISSKLVPLSNLASIFRYVLLPQTKYCRTRKYSTLYPAPEEDTNLFQKEQAERSHSRYHHSHRHYKHVHQDIYIKRNRGEIGKRLISPTEQSYNCITSAIFLKSCSRNTQSVGMELIANQEFPEYRGHYIY